MPSLHSSAELFEYLKEDKEEPDPNTMIAKSGQQLPAEFVTDQYDIEAKEFLLCLPGVNANNVYSVINSVKCIADLIGLSVEELTEILGNFMSAEQPYECLHSKLIDRTNEDFVKLKEKKRKRFANKRTKT